MAQPTHFELIIFNHLVVRQISPEQACGRAEATVWDFVLHDISQSMNSAGPLPAYVLASVVEGTPLEGCMQQMQPNFGGTAIVQLLQQLTAEAAAAGAELRLTIITDGEENRYRGPLQFASGYLQGQTVNYTGKPCSVHNDLRGTPDITAQFMHEHCAHVMLVGIGPEAKRTVEASMKHGGADTFVIEVNKDTNPKHVHGLVRTARRRRTARDQKKNHVVMVGTQQGAELIKLDDDVTAAAAEPAPVQIPVTADAVPPPTGQDELKQTIDGSIAACHQGVERAAIRAIVAEILVQSCAGCVAAAMLVGKNGRLRVTPTVRSAVNSALSALARQVAGMTASKSAVASHVEYHGKRCKIPASTQMYKVSGGSTTNLQAIAADTAWCTPLQDLLAAGAVAKRRSPSPSAQTTPKRQCGTIAL